MKSLKMAASIIGAACTISSGGASAQSGGVLLPITITNASGNVADMGFAADGNPNTIWNSGGLPSQWINIDLGSERMISKMRLLPAQSPASAGVSHIVWAYRSDGSKYRLLALERTITQDNQWIDLYNNLETTVRYLTVETTRSPSWVAWRELQIFDGGTLESTCDFNVNRNGWALISTSLYGGCGIGNYRYFYRDVRNLPSGAGVQSCVTIDGVPGLIKKEFRQNIGKCDGFLQDGYYYYEQQ
ncbi:discoidin domain-containing protein [Delftia sp. PE138]|uniref:discoidin domain-containing protein n=1 Tax=Delftia sp. PE138 TaxID=1812483 RepID=UPI001BB03CEF|nr:discoidin domain-containing protein [Delftia sp. PE138]MBS3723990.1 hypothetical protein [Delftia sp. PE138]